MNHYVVLNAIKSTGSFCCSNSSYRLAYLKQFPGWSLGSAVQDQGHSDHRAPRGVSQFHYSLMTLTSKCQTAAVGSRRKDYTDTNTVHAQLLSKTTVSALYISVRKVPFCQEEAIYLVLCKRCNMPFALSLRFRKYSWEKLLFHNDKEPILIDCAAAVSAVQCCKRPASGMNAAMHLFDRDLHDFAKLMVVVS